MISSFCSVGGCVDVTPTVRLRFNQRELWAFIQGCRAGEFDHFVDEALRAPETVQNPVPTQPLHPPTRIQPSRRP
jgi:hypothetical protein